MSLNMYLGEVQSQTQSMNAICNATIQSMEQAIQSIDAFAIDTVLQGQTYSSAKAYLVQTFRPLAQGLICLCEELIRQNEAFPNEFQAKVASTDVIEQEIREQIRGINQSITSIEAIEVLTPMPGVGAIVTVLGAMRKKLEEKLEHLYEFNHSSSNNYSTALQLAASITAGLAEVQSGKGFSPVSGTFSTQGLNMDWVSSIQGIIEEIARKNDQSIKDIEINNIIEKKSPVRNAWDDATDSIVGTFETAKKMWEAIQRGSGKAIGDEIESAIALSNMDIGTFINVTYALFHLDETAKNMWHAFSNKIKRDMIEGDAESRTELTTYGLTQIATTILGDRALNKVGHITKGAKASSGVSTFANAVKLAKELKPTLEMLQSFKREASYAFSSVGGTIVTKIPQGELIEAYYKFAKSKDGGKGTGDVGKGVSGAGSKIDGELIRKYVRDIETQTNRKIPKKQMEELKSALRNTEYKKMTSSETKRYRREFNKIKNSLIDEWEKQTGQKWPTYTEDVISEKTGKILRKKGEPYDAHHIIENSYRGEHEWWNIHPAKFPNEHQGGIHGSGSPGNKLFNGGK
ncbi:T7SS effector LXG polymorphic toxin [Bacillus cereus]|nr:T7SS effector LXG polymorphic toxin [Bacillus cereus]MEC2755718.1 T7SS effector LXG polymorphic toxin [Bacillus cereus]MEC2826304.1 T7SS effector LXG polymorphic toxin [Bacillus cereus]